MTRGPAEATATTLPVANASLLTAAVPHRAGPLPPAKAHAGPTGRPTEAAGGTHSVKAAAADDDEEEEEEEEDEEDEAAAAAADEEEAAAAEAATAAACCEAALA